MGVARLGVSPRGGGVRSAGASRGSWQQPAFLLAGRGHAGRLARPLLRFDRAARARAPRSGPRTRGHGQDDRVHGQALMRPSTSWRLPRRESTRPVSECRDRQSNRQRGAPSTQGRARGGTVQVLVVSRTEVSALFVASAYVLDRRKMRGIVSGRSRNARVISLASSRARPCRGMVSQRFCSHGRLIPTARSQHPGELD